MEQRDLLQEQIEQLGRVLGKILSDFLGLKSSGKVTQGIEISNQRFQNELNIDIKKLLTFDYIKLKAYLHTHQFTWSHLEMLSDYLTEVGNAKAAQLEKAAYLKKAIALLDIADDISDTVSLERMQKKSIIQNML